jgi:hypothetical protein
MENFICAFNLFQKCDGVVCIQFVNLVYFIDLNLSSQYKNCRMYKLIKDEKRENSNILTLVLAERPLEFDVDDQLGFPRGRPLSGPFLGFLAWRIYIASVAAQAAANKTAVAPRREAHRANGTGAAARCVLLTGHRTRRFEDSEAVC